LLQDNVVALGVSGSQAKSAGTRCILGQGDGLGGHVLGQTRAFLPAVRYDGLLHLTVALGLRPRGGGDTALKAGAFHQQTPQAHATGTHCRTHQGYPEHQTRQEGQPWDTVEKGHDGGMVVTTFLRRPPCLPRATGPIKRLGGLTEGEPLGVQIAILIEECSASGAIPSWGTIRMASWLGLDDGAHRNLLV